MKKRGCGATAGRHSLLSLYWLLERNHYPLITTQQSLSTNHSSLLTPHPFLLFFFVCFRKEGNLK